MSTEQLSIQEIEQQIKEAQINIDTLKKTKQSKEILVDDLRALLERISEEQAFLMTFKPVSEASKLNLKTLILAKGHRKYSEDSTLSNISKCASHTTKAYSNYKENEDAIIEERREEHEPDYYMTKKESNDTCYSYSYGYKGKNSEGSKINLIVRQKCLDDNRNNQNIIKKEDEHHLICCFKYWNENIPLYISSKKTPEFVVLY